MKIKLTPQLVLANSNNIFVPDFLFLKQSIAFINFSIGTCNPGELLFHLHEVFFVGDCVGVGCLLYQEFFVKHAGSEVLGV